MFHNYSGGTIGKGGEMIDQLQHERKWSKSLMTEIYANFLTEDEIEHMLDNKDYWMDGKEVVQRLNKRNQLLLDSVTEKPKKVSAKKLPVPATKSMPTKKAAAKKVKPKVN
jgi:ATP-dependent protease ClpP protease subunit